MTKVLSWPVEMSVRQQVLPVLLQDLQSVHVVKVGGHMLVPPGKAHRSRKVPLSEVGLLAVVTLRHSVSLAPVPVAMDSTEAMDARLVVEVTVSVPWIHSPMLLL